MSSLLPVVIVTGSKFGVALRYRVTFQHHICIGQWRGGWWGELQRVYLHDDQSAGRSLCSSDPFLKQPLSTKPIMQEVTF